MPYSAHRLQGFFIFLNDTDEIGVAHARDQARCDLHRPAFCASTALSRASSVAPGYDPGTIFTDIVSWRGGGQPDAGRVSTSGHLAISHIVSKVFSYFPCFLILPSTHDPAGTSRVSLIFCNFENLRLLQGPS